MSREGVRSRSDARREDGKEIETVVALAPYEVS